jgi:hypothetical protein
MAFLLFPYCEPYIATCAEIDVGQELSRKDTWKFQHRILFSLASLLYPNIGTEEAPTIDCDTPKLTPAHPREDRTDRLGYEHAFAARSTPLTAVAATLVG